MAYAVGLIATDGCLIDKPPQIAFVRQDRQLVETFLACIGREIRYRTVRTRLGRALYRAQFKDIVLYRWFESIGLTPRKSLTLGPLAVPDDLLGHLVRGLLDGDGSIVNGVWRADTTRRSDYYYEFFRVQFVSGSHAHVDWLRSQLASHAGLRGGITTTLRPGRHASYRLAYGKHDSIALLRLLYAERDAPCLIRKRMIWDSYRDRNGLDSAIALRHQWARRDSNPHALSSNSS